MYRSNYVAKEECPALKDELINLAWETKRTARHEYFMSATDREYVYGGMSAIKYNSQPFSPLVKSLCARLNVELGADFNVCFLNKYDDEKQHLGWHADDFIGMKPNQPIAVISFGAEREIWVKPKEQKGVIPDGQKYLLGEGSLFLMPIGYQNTHLHKIPKWDRPCGWRISLTFRSFN
jgi:alkylated DNA repair dioxygenase AlkB